MSYVGNKNFSNVICELVNRIPISERYFSLFFGHGGLEQSDYMDNAFFICSEMDDDCKKSIHKDSSVIVENDYRILLNKYNPNEKDFIFADPPYMFLTRLAARKYYKFEFSTKNHIEFLDYVTRLHSRILITHPKCDLYDKKLIGWNFSPMRYQTRGGAFEDGIYTNYNHLSCRLVNYECLGSNFVERQQIKRKRKNFISKFDKMSFHERQAILEYFKSNLA